MLYIIKYFFILKKKNILNYFPFLCSNLGLPFLVVGLSFPLFNNGCVSKNKNIVEKLNKFIINYNNILPSTGAPCK